MFKAGDLVVKIIQGPGSKTATLARLRGRPNSAGTIVFTGDGFESDDVDAYYSRNGLATQNFIPGFSSYLVALDGGEEERLGLENWNGE